MRKSLLTIIGTIAFLFGYSQHPYNQKLDDIAIITFPDTAEVNENASGKTFSCTYDGVLYQAQASKLGSSIKDLITDGKLSDVYAGFLSGLLKSTNGKLIYKKNIDINDLKGWEVEIIAPKFDDSVYCFARVFVLNDILVEYTVWSDNSTALQDKKPLEFLQSLYITTSKKNRRQSGGEELAAKLGHTTAYLLIAGLVIFTIVRITRNQRQAF